MMSTIETEVIVLRSGVLRTVKISLSADVTGNGQLALTINNLCDALNKANMPPPAKVEIKPPVAVSQTGSKGGAAKPEYTPSCKEHGPMRQSNWSQPGFALFYCSGKVQSGGYCPNKAKVSEATGDVTYYQKEERQ